MKLQFPAGTPVTIELRSNSKSEYVDGTIVGAHGRQIIVKTFDGKIKHVDPDCVWADKVDPPDEPEESVAEPTLLEILQRTPWPEFKPQQQPSAIR